MSKEELQKKYFESQLLSQQAQKIQEQMLILEQQQNELRNSIESLNEFGNVKEGSRLFSPIIPGIYLDTELKNNKELLVNVGAGVVTKKTIKEAVEFLDQKIDELDNVIKQLETHLIKLATESQKLEEELRKLSQE